MRESDSVRRFLEPVARRRRERAGEKEGFHAEAAEVIRSATRDQVAASAQEAPEEQSASTSREKEEVTPVVSGRCRTVPFGVKYAFHFAFRAAETREVDCCEGAPMTDDNRDVAGQTTAGLFDRLAAGDPGAVNDLLIHFRDRLHRLAKKMFRAEGRLPDLYQTDDVEQGAAIRLVRALDEENPTTPLQFMRLAATCIRRELCDLSRKEYGPHGDGRHVFANRPGDGDAHDELVAGRADSEAGPATRAAEGEFHQKVRELPEPELEVFELIHYGGHTHQEVADRLGVSASTVKRRWYDAQECLHALLRGTRPTPPPPG
jgi:RNA polymerase sigma-70 factor (ECF subfamily)